MFFLEEDSTHSPVLRSRNSSSSSHGLTRTVLFFFFVERFGELFFEGLFLELFFELFFGELFFELEMRPLTRSLLRTFPPSPEPCLGYLRPLDLYSFFNSSTLILLIRDASSADITTLPTSFLYYFMPIFFQRHTSEKLFLPPYVSRRRCSHKSTDLCELSSDISRYDDLSTFELGDVWHCKNVVETSTVVLPLVRVPRDFGGSDSNIISVTCKYQVDFVRCTTTDLVFRYRCSVREKIRDVDNVVGLNLTHSCFIWKDVLVLRGTQLFCKVPWHVPTKVKTICFSDTLPLDYYALLYLHFA